MIGTQTQSMYANSGFFAHNSGSIKSKMSTLNSINAIVSPSECPFETKFTLKLNCNPFSHILALLPNVPPKSNSNEGIDLLLSQRCEPASFRSGQQQQCKQLYFLPRTVDSFFITKNVFVRHITTDTCKGYLLLVTMSMFRYLLKSAHCSDKIEYLQQWHSLIL